MGPNSFTDWLHPQSGIFFSLPFSVMPLDKSCKVSHIRVINSYFVWFRRRTLLRSNFPVKTLRISWSLCMLYILLTKRLTVSNSDLINGGHLWLKRVN